MVTIQSPYSSLGIIRNVWPFRLVDFIINSQCHDPSLGIQNSRGLKYLRSEFHRVTSIPHHIPHHCSSHTTHQRNHSPNLLKQRSASASATPSSRPHRNSIAASISGRHQFDLLTLYEPERRMLLVTMRDETKWWIVDGEFATDRKNRKN